MRKNAYSGNVRSAVNKRIKSMPQHPVGVTTHPPKIFCRLCEEYYHVTPERLANALIYEFCVRPPRELVLIEHAEVREEQAVSSGQE